MSALKAFHTSKNQAQSLPKRVYPDGQARRPLGPGKAGLHSPPEARTRQSLRSIRTRLNTIASINAPRNPLLSGAHLCVAPHEVGKGLF